ncbi:MAG: sigma-54-dependent Fis family transcriptional regulator [Planctomycetes bacterium]|nr:sigma-54-dependent Fis family transcriptional regulator [Planctomycetota bacterium]
MTDRILLADDEMTFRETLARFLRDELLDVTTVDNGLDAIEAARTTAFGVVILDIQMPGADGIKALRDIMSMRPAARVIMVTAYGTVERAVEAIKLGACDYVVKPVIFDDILVKIKQHLRFAELQAENLELKRVLNDQFDLSQMIGDSQSIRMVLDMIQKVSQTRSNVLITGESGTGKELVARAIHSLGQSNGKRFVAVNCGAIPEALLESELFGHKKGSFTSASEDKKGLFECARGGTLFLDEIGYMNVNCQIKLLRAVEQRQITPVGSTEPIALELRLVAATNRDLLKEIREGNFREDLYYRLNVVGIHTPALRERVEDIPLLVNHFIEKYNTELGKQCQGVTEEGMRMLMGHEWKGNIRELENVIERSIIFSEEDLIDVKNLGLLSPYVDAVDGADDNLQNTLKAFEKQHILRVLKKHSYDKTQASRALGVGLSSLYRKMDELDIRVARSKL